MEKIYRLYGIDIAIDLLRPGAKYEIYNNDWTRWDDPRPCPSMEEVRSTLQKIKDFEDSFETIWLSDHYEDMKKYNDMNIVLEENRLKTQET